MKKAISLILALVLLAAVMLAVALATWGSIGSAVMLYGLIIMVCALLYRRFLLLETDDWNSE